VDPFTVQLRTIVDRYLDGRQALDSAAADFADVWSDYLAQAGPNAPEPPSSQQRNAQFSNLHVLHVIRELRPNLTEDEFHDIAALLAHAVNKLGPADKGAA